MLLSLLLCLTSRVRICLYPSYTQQNQHFQSLALLAFSVIPSHMCGSRNINLVSIDYASQPRLRSRLTLGGRPFPRKPLSIGVWDSHPHSLLTPAFSLLYSPQFLPVLLLPVYNAPLPLLRVLSFGIMLSPGKSSAQSHSTSELLRTLLMVAASEPTS